MLVVLDPWLEPVAAMQHRGRISSHSVAATDERPHHDPSCTRCRARGAGPICRAAFCSQPIKRSACPGSSEADQTSRMRMSSLVPFSSTSVPLLPAPGRGPESARARRGVSVPGRQCSSGGSGRPQRARARRTSGSACCPAGAAARAKPARSSPCAGADCRTWRCPAHAGCGRSAKALAPSRRRRPAAAGWRMSGTGLRATAAWRSPGRSL